jgi:phosphoribosylglycinamide formyltransferase-1
MTAIIRKPLQLAVLISGAGTTLQNLIDRIKDQSLNARIAVVVASRAGVKGIERASSAGLRCELIEAKKYLSPTQFQRDVVKSWRKSGAELICLAGWLSLLDIPMEFAGRVMNIHPALLPSFGGKGMYGPRVHQAVLDAGCKISGCTVHFVDSDYDAGPIILQRSCPVLETDTPQTLAARVFEEEKIAYPQAIGLFAAGRLRIEGKRVKVV